METKDYIAKADTTLDLLKNYPEVKYSNNNLSIEELIMDTAVYEVVNFVLIYIGNCSGWG